MQSDRRDELYLAALQGGSPSALLLRHAEIHILTVEEATEDWEFVLTRLRLDSTMSQELELARIRAARWQVVSEANRRGQFMASGGALRDLGMAAGEQQAALLGAVQNAPMLRIVVEQAPALETGSGALTEAAESDPVEVLPS